jgi:hypothetical protein
LEENSRGKDQEEKEEGGFGRKGGGRRAESKLWVKFKLTTEKGENRGENDLELHQFPKVPETATSSPRYNHSIRVQANYHEENCQRIKELRGIWQMVKTRPGERFKSWRDVPRVWGELQDVWRELPELRRCGTLEEDVGRLRRCGTLEEMWDG